VSPASRYAIQLNVYDTANRVWETFLAEFIPTLPYWDSRLSGSVCLGLMRQVFNFPSERRASVREAASSPIPHQKGLLIHIQGQSEGVVHAIRGGGDGKCVCSFRRAQISRGAAAASTASSYHDARKH